MPGVLRNTEESSMARTVGGREKMLGGRASTGQQVLKSCGGRFKEFIIISQRNWKSLEDFEQKNPMI